MIVGLSKFFNANLIKFGCIIKKFKLLKILIEFDFIIAIIFIPKIFKFFSFFLKFFLFLKIYYF